MKINEAGELITGGKPGSQENWEGATDMKSHWQENARAKAVAVWVIGTMNTDLELAGEAIEVFEELKREGWTPTAAEIDECLRAIDEQRLD